MKKLIGAGEYLLLTLDQWFFAKDGQNYRAVWGLCRIVEAKDVFGFKPAHGTNWYAVVGTGKDALFIAGCQIHFAQLCLDKPIGTHVLEVE